jgi:hypothetical protein
MSALQHAWTCLPNDQLPAKSAGLGRKSAHPPGKSERWGRKARLTFRIRGRGWAFSAAVVQWWGIKWGQQASTATFVERHT